MVAVLVMTCWPDLALAGPYLSVVLYGTERVTCLSVFVTPVTSRCHDPQNTSRSNCCQQAHLCLTFVVTHWALTAIMSDIAHIVDMALYQWQCLWQSVRLHLLLLLLFVVAGGESPTCSVLRGRHINVFLCELGEVWEEFHLMHCLIINCTFADNMMSTMTKRPQPPLCDEGQGQQD